MFELQLLQPFNFAFKNVLFILTQPTIYFFKAYFVDIIILLLR